MPTSTTASTAASRSARGRLGLDHPFVVDGAERTGGGEHEERSPIDQELVLGRFAQATAADVADAVAAARRSAPGWAATPWQERVAVLDAADDLISEQRYRVVGADDHGSGEEPPRGAWRCRGVGGSHPLLLPRDGGPRGIHPGDEPAVTRRGDLGRDAPLRGVGGDQPVQLPDGAGCRPGGGRPGRRKHGGDQAVQRRGDDGGAAVPGLRPPVCRQVPSISSPGRGRVAGDALVRHPDVDGITFTGSYEVGMGIQRSFAADSRSRRSARWVARTR